MIRKSGNRFWPRNKRQAFARKFMLKQEMRRETDSTGLKQSLAGLARGLDGVAGVAADQRGILPDRRGFADKIALHRVAAHLREETELFLGFHPLRDDRHFQAVAKADHRPNDRRRLRIASEIHDEGAVDLDLVERKSLKIAQGRIAA